MNINTVKIALFACLSATALVACQPQASVGKTLKPLNTQSANITPGAPYYPVGKAPSSGSADVSLLPPGQNLAPLKRRHKELNSLHLAMSMKQAWAKVNVALAKTRYSVMDKDAALRVIYVLDRDLTQGKLTRKTPIYQIHLTQVAAGVEVTLSAGDNNLLSSASKSAVLGQLSKAL